MGINMKKTCKITVLLLVSFCILTGCKTTRRSSSSNSNLNNIIRNHDERIADMTFQLKQVAESNNQAIRRLNELIKENATLKSKVATLENNVATLTKALEAERNNRHTETEKLLKEVAQQTTAAINARNKALMEQRQKSGGKPTKKGNYYIYTVQPGATLGAIAKAYKVTVSDIKKANNLKSDIIRVGQKLYIPKK